MLRAECFRVKIEECKMYIEPTILVCAIMWGVSFMGTYSVIQWFMNNRLLSDNLQAKLWKKVLSDNIGRFGGRR